MQVKHLKHASETLAKTHEKYLKTIIKDTQHQDKTIATYVQNICNIQKHTYNKHMEKIDETIVTPRCYVPI